MEEENSLAGFLQGIEEKKDYPKGFQLDLNNNELGAEGAKVLAMALKSGRCPPGFQLILGSNRLGAEGAAALASALESGHCPQDLFLWLYHNQLGVEGGKSLADALQSGQCPQGLQLELMGNQLGAEGVKALAMALQSGQCPQGLRLNLYGNELGTEGATALAMALQSGQCPQGLQLDLGGDQLGAEGVKALAMALQSGKCPQGLALNLMQDQPSIGAVESLAMALQSGQCPQELRLGLAANQLGTEGAKVLAMALQSGQCPQGLQLDLSNNQLGEGIYALTMALQSGRCPPRLQLNLSFNNLGPEGAKVLAIALQSGQCPPGLALELAKNFIDDVGTKALAMALQSGRCSQGLQLKLGSNRISTDGVTALAIALRSGQCPQGLVLKISYKKFYNGEKKLLREAWADYHRIQQDSFINCMTLYQGHGQVDSPIHLPQEVLQEIYRRVLPATPILAKMTQISTKVFRKQWVNLNDTSAHAKQLDSALDVALSSPRLTEKAAKIRSAINDFLQKALETHEVEKVVHSSTVALLNKYHLLARNTIQLTALSRKPSADDIVAIASRGDFEEALALANYSDKENAMWSLGLYYETEGGDFRKAMVCYQAIAKDNIYYQQGHYRIATIILNLLLTHQRQSICLSTEEISTYRRQFLSHLLKAVDKPIQPVMQFYYQQLCDLNIGTPINEEGEEKLIELMQAVAHLQLLQQQKELQANNLQLEKPIIERHAGKGSAAMIVQTPFAGWQNLPPEQWHHILSYLNNTELYSIAVTNKEQLHVSLPLVHKRAAEVIFSIMVKNHTTWCITSTELYACGRNTKGQLGLGTRLSSAKFKPVKGLPAGRRILQVAAGSSHAFVLTEEGLYACGENGHGQLGLGHDEDKTSFVKVTTLPPGKIWRVFIEDEVTVLLTDTGLYACGSTREDNWLGISPVPGQSCNTFTFIPGLPGGQIQQVEVGALRILVVMEEGLYVCGDNSFGQLSVGDIEDPNRRFNKVIGLPPGQIQQVIAKEVHTMVVINNTLYACGSNWQGQTGLGNTSQPTFTQVPGLPAGQVLGLFASDFHTLVLTNVGPYVAGDNQCGELGLGHYQRCNFFTKVEQWQWPAGQMLLAAVGNGQTYVLTDQGLFDCRKNAAFQAIAPFTPIELWPQNQILQLVVGKGHTVITTDEKIYVSGSNEYGQLGLNNDSRAVHTFTEVEALPKKLKQQLALKQHFKQLTQLGPNFFANPQTVNKKKRKYAVSAEESEEACSRNQKQKIAHASLK